MDEQTAENRIRLALADDQVLFRASLGRFLATQPGFELAGECGTAAEVLELLNASAVDIVLSDLDLLTERGDDLISAARSAGYKGRFLIVAGAADAREQPTHPSRQRCAAPKPPCHPSSGSRQRRCCGKRYRRRCTTVRPCGPRFCRPPRQHHRPRSPLPRARCAAIPPRRRASAGRPWPWPGKRWRRAQPSLRANEYSDRKSGG